jgi:sigma-B regulation protein RsbU (phosphoserine phosphatase)
MWPGVSPAELEARRDALRVAASLPGSDPRMLLEAALAELDAALEHLPASADGPAVPDGSATERRLLRAAFQQAPVALFLLEQDGSIRRANAAAGELTGTPGGYATGKSLTAFIDLPSRAALASLLAAVLRTGEPRQVACRVLGKDGPVKANLSVRAISLPGDLRLLVVSAETAGHPAAPQRVTRDTGEDQAIRTMARRMDTITSVTRLLLDNSTFSEGVTLQRCARMLVRDIACWVIIDVDMGAGLRRQIVTGPQDSGQPQLAVKVRGVDPAPGTLCDQVHASGTPALVAHAEDLGMLGTDPDGIPLLVLLESTSLICVPISDGETRYGTLTLARRSAEGRFDVADLGLAEQLGEHLAIAMRVDRMFRRRSEVAQALGASLLPSRLAEIPGLDLAASYTAATRWQEVSGDFYDIFPVRDGQSWGIVIGDVSGKGEEAAAITAAARHATRSIGYRDTNPVTVLQDVNEILFAAGYEDRFVTTGLAFLSHAGDEWNVRLGVSGHPGPAVLRADGRVEIMEGDGLPLALFADRQVASEARFALSPGDLLLLYTDGVTDAGFIEDRLAAVAGRSAAETVRAIQELVTESCDGDLRDDMTMVAVKVTGELPVVFFVHVLDQTAARCSRCLWAAQRFRSPHAGYRGQASLHPLHPRVACDIRRVGRLVDPPAGRPPLSAADDPPAQPIVLRPGNDQSEHAGEYQHVADSVQVHD